MGDKTALKNAQRSTTKKVIRVRNVSYKQRSRELEMPILAYERSGEDMIETLELSKITIIRN